MARIDKNDFTEGSWMWQNRENGVGNDIFIDVNLGFIEAAASSGDMESASWFVKRLTNTVKKEQFIRSVGKAADLPQLISDIRNSYNSGVEEFTDKLNKIISEETPINSN